MHALAVLVSGGPLDSPFIVPVAGCLMVLGIVVAGAWSGARQREIQSQERMAAIAKGLPLPPTVEELAILHGKPSSSLARRRANMRTAGIVLLATAAGLAAFFLMLTVVLREPRILCGVAAALIPLAIGIGFLFDAGIQAKEIQKIESDAPVHTL